MFLDYIIVGARKPSFFSEGNTLREVNLETGQLNVKKISKFEPGHVYNGGSMAAFSQLSGSKVKFSSFFCQLILINFEFLLCF